VRLIGEGPEKRLPAQLAGSMRCSMARWCSGRQRRGRKGIVVARPKWSAQRWEKKEASRLLQSLHGGRWLRNLGHTRAEDSAARLWLVGDVAAVAWWGAEAAME
jgi:hypothetical protein